MAGATAVIPAGIATEALHVFVGSSSTLVIESGASLKVIDSPGNGISMRGDLQNQGNIIVRTSGARGISISDIGAASSFTNEGHVEITDTGFKGLYLSFQAQVHNLSSIIITNAGMATGGGIELRALGAGNPCKFVNDGDIQLLGSTGHGLDIKGVFENKSELTIQGAGSRGPSLSDPLAAIRIDSTTVSGTSFTGEFVNSGQVQIDNCLDSGIIVDNACNLTNNGGGLIVLSGTVADGMICRPRSITTCSGSGSRIMLGAIGGIPLDISQLSEFSVGPLARLDVDP